MMTISSLWRSRVLLLSQLPPVMGVVVAAVGGVAPPTLEGSHGGASFRQLSGEDREESYMGPRAVTMMKMMQGGADGTDAFGETGEGLYEEGYGYDQEQGEGEGSSDLELEDGADDEE